MKHVLCENCGEHPATVHFTQSVNGVKKEMYLCSHCAGKMGLSGKENPFGEDLFGLFSMFSQPTEPMVEKSPVCPVCKTTLDAVRKKGVFGCSACYDAFSSKLDMTPFVGGGYRAGRLSEKAEKAESTESPEKQKEDEIALLRRKLQEALKTENYEEAARLRDRIREKEGK